MQRVVGHHSVFDRFERTLRRGRLASTYLFVGPVGIGKRAFAEHLAAGLLCQRSSDTSFQPCGECDSCRLSQSASHPDLLLVSKPDGKSTLPIDLFVGPPDKRNREGLCHDLARRPMLSDRRVAIIDDADDLSPESANCLLKTLEEPPPRSLMILIGSSLGRQLPTIRSRSQVVRFAPLSESEVAQVLQSEPHEFDAEQASQLAGDSGGSVSRALELTDVSFNQARQAVVDCLSSQSLDPLRLTKLLDEQSKSAGTEPSLRRRLLREMFDAAIGHYRSDLLSLASHGAAVDRVIWQLEQCLTADESLSRNANQSALVQHLATNLWRLQQAAQ